MKQILSIFILGSLSSHLHAKVYPVDSLFSEDVLSCLPGQNDKILNLYALEDYQSKKWGFIFA